MPSRVFIPMPSYLNGLPMAFRVLPCQLGNHSFQIQTAGTWLTLFVLWRQNNNEPSPHSISCLYFCAHKFHRYCVFANQKPMKKFFCTFPSIMLVLSLLSCTM